MISDGYLEEKSVQHGYGNTIELSSMSYNLLVLCCIKFLCSAKGKHWLSQAKREPNHPLKITPSNEMLAHEKTAQTK